MTLLTFLMLPVASLACGAIAMIAVARGNDDLAAHAARHMVAYSLVNLACWFVL
jgi:hypothetical protein